MENALDAIAESAETIAVATETPRSPEALEPAGGEGEDQQTGHQKLPVLEIMDLIEEAEKRGYWRAVEEARKKDVDGSRGMWAEPGVADDEPLDTGAGILRCMRRGVWDD